MVSKILGSIGIAFAIWLAINSLKDYQSPLAKKITEGVRKHREQARPCPE